MVLRLPRSAFLDQAHIRTICTRVQFATDNCPAGAVYGQAKAFTPLLEQPLEGPVILRSSDPGPARASSHGCMTASVAQATAGNAQFTSEGQ